ncbi:RNA ligase/cyclic nucleotide phosphodiesterase [Podospora appendiculata]|uniref:RNA ligase/cyclic nucleotide phosphodiesterase n=1 Tax=Podospora appendiculata TaxID=314037 RepID=A0AAE0XJ25_9PEZI|nr:RNA ligase/cyclic nucleotide phosphodiesterase [Podospora appendiculata]
MPTEPHQDGEGEALRPEYPIGVPSKFDPDGNVQRFPGNTIVAHLPLSSPIYASLLKLYERLSTCHLSGLLAMLPPSSWHVTLFEGVCDQVRAQEGFWPCDPGLPVDAPLDDCTSSFAGKLREFDLRCDPPYRFVIVGFSPLDVGIGIHVELQTPPEESRLRGLRDRLAETLKIRHPQHDVYEFHLSMAYLLRHLSDSQKSELTALLLGHLQDMPKVFELGAPEFCTFDNMLQFDHLFYLGDQEK